MRQATRRALAAATLLGLAGALPLAAQEPYGLPLRGEAAETFLRTAEVVKKKALGSGITHSEQYTLTDGTQTHKAVWKTIKYFVRGLTTYGSGLTILDAEDSYRFEIAAYELDKLLGLDLVPPAVERTFDRKKGSLQLWVEGAMTEADRKEKGLTPPDVEAWNRQIHKVRLLRQLTDDWDAQNITNTLLDPSFRVYAIDFSRSFTTYGWLREAKALERFSRSALEALRRLDQATLEARLGPWIRPPQVRALLKRRDRILAIAARRVAEEGEAAVLYP
jgi:hypothetical protein